LAMALRARQKLPGDALLSVIAWPNAPA